MERHVEEISKNDLCEAIKSELKKYNEKYLDLFDELCNKNKLDFATEGEICSLKCKYLICLRARTSYYYFGNCECIMHIVFSLSIALFHLIVLRAHSWWGHKDLSERKSSATPG